MSAPIRTSRALEPRTFTVTGTLVAAPWTTQPATLKVTTTHYALAIEIAEDDARSAGLLFIDARAVAQPVASPVTLDPSEQQGEEVAR